VQKHEKIVFRSLATGDDEKWKINKLCFNYEFIKTQFSSPVHELVLAVLKKRVEIEMFKGKIIGIVAFLWSEIQSKSSIHFDSRLMNFESLRDSRHLWRFTGGG
jgi:hypothetical protein